MRMREQEEVAEEQEEGKQDGEEEDCLDTVCALLYSVHILSQERVACLLLLFDNMDRHRDEAE